MGPWNTLEVFAIPSAVTRLLVATTPAAPTLNGYYDVLYAYYQATADTDSAQATYALASAQNTLNIAQARPDGSDLGSVVASALMTGAAGRDRGG